MRDGAREVVFEQALARGIQERDRGSRVQAAHCESEINLVPTQRGKRLAFHAVNVGRILGVGIRHRIQPFYFEVSLRVQLVFVEQIFDARGIGFEIDGRCRIALAEIKSNLHRCIDPAENPPGALRKRVQFVFRQINALDDWPQDHVQSNDDHHHDRRAHTRI